MKTNSAARRVWKLRLSLACVGIALLVGTELTVGESLAARFGQTTACQTEGPPVPNVDLSALMAATR